MYIFFINLKKYLPEIIGFLVFSLVASLVFNSVFVILDFVVAQIHDTKLVWTRAIPSDENNSLRVEKFYYF